MRRIGFILLLGVAVFGAAFASVYAAEQTLEEKLRYLEDQDVWRKLQEALENRPVAALRAKTAEPAPAEEPAQAKPEPAKTETAAQPAAPAEEPAEKPGTAPGEKPPLTAALAPPKAPAAPAAAPAEAPRKTPGAAPAPRETMEGTPRAAATPATESAAAKPAGGAPTPKLGLVRVPAGLQGFSLEEFRFTGLLQTGANTWGILTDPRGVNHHVGPGTVVGRQGARVVAVTPGVMTFHNPSRAGGLPEKVRLPFGKKLEEEP